MAISDDIRAAIDKNLSAEIGTSLKTRLQLAEDMEKHNKLLRQQIEDLQSKYNKALNQLNGHEQIDDKLKRLDEREKEIWNKTVDARLIELREQHAGQRVADMKEIVLAVFANSRFKYSVMENGSIPVPMQNGMYPASSGYTRNATGEGEGAPPPPPVAPTPG